MKYLALTLSVIFVFNLMSCAEESEAVIRQMEENNESIEQEEEVEEIVEEVVEEVIDEMVEDEVIEEEEAEEMIDEVVDEVVDEIMDEVEDGEMPEIPEEEEIEDMVEEVIDEMIEDEDSEITAETKCDYDQFASIIEAGSDEIQIDCLYDLGGQTVDIPASKALLFDGGDIFNGTLNFESAGKIDYQLLNSKLAIEGDVTLTSEVFNFHPNRWNVTEGLVSDEVARNNRLFLNEIFLNIKALGATSIEIDQLDAYFYNVPELKERPQDAAIQVPANIHLLLSNNTNLRVQPNNYKDTKLLTLFEADDSKLEGGILHGDRDEHDYSDGGTHEWGHLIMIKSSSNVIVEGVTMMDAGGDGISISALGHAFNDNHNPCNNVKILNNKIIRSRRAGISIVDGTNILIDGNEIIDIGTSTDESEGTGPGFAINIEPIWTGGIKYEIVENVTISNNIERGSEKGGIVCARGYYITYENNTMESTIYMGETVGSIIRNNIFANPTENSPIAIYAGDNEPYDDVKNYDNQVYGNTITGFDKGIQLQGQGMDLNNNTMINCGSGILIKNSKNCKVRDNTIINEISDSEGIGTAFPDYIDNVVISDNTIRVMGAPFRLTSVNTEDYTENFIVTIENNTATSLNEAQSVVQLSQGFEFKNNTCNNSGIRTIDAYDGMVSGNSFLNNYIRIGKGCSDISFSDNIITGDNCIEEDRDDAINITRANNSCDNDQ